MARRYWPGTDPVGPRIKGQDKRGASDDWITVIGVVGDMRRHGLEQRPTAHVFAWYLQSGDFPQDLVIRTTGDPAAMAATVRSVARSADPSAIISQITTVQQELASQLAPRRFQTWLLGLFSALALLLASIGIYGVMHYAVTRRTHEIGIRMALGAQSGDVLRLVVRQGMFLAGGGIAIGLAAAGLMTRLMTNLLFGVRPDDPFTFGFVCALLVTVAAVASFLPARRAACTDPVHALRHD
jgi:putative ABC transport system permease protein